MKTTHWIVRAALAAILAAILLSGLNEMVAIILLVTAGVLAVTGMFYMDQDRRKTAKIHHS